jgi:hypothetical protein
VVFALRELRYFHSEPELLHDEYLQIINNKFGLTENNSHAIFAKMGITKALESLKGIAYPLPNIRDFQWFLRNTRPIGISDGLDVVICVAEKFYLDSFYKFDWINSYFSVPILTEAEKTDLFCYVAKITIYKTIKHAWDRYEV